MRLLEYKSKGILRQYGIPTPKGEVAFSPEEAVEITERLGGKSVLKVQIPAGRRGKVGGIKLVGSPQEAGSIAKHLLSTTFYGFKPECLLVEEPVDVMEEYYLGAIVDRSSRSLTFISSSKGGMNVEEMAKEYPESVLKVSIDPFIGMQPYQSRMLAKNMNESTDIWKTLTKIVLSLWKVADDYDSFMLEINPLAVCEGGRVLALDARIEIDDNALFRHPELGGGEEGLAYVELDGNVGTMANGAGLAMATMDLVYLLGGKPANFCDVGGGASAEAVFKALKRITSNSRVKSVVINTLCGITNGIEVAKGIKRFLEEGCTVPIVVRLAGNGAEEGSKILEETGVIHYSEPEEAVKEAIRLAGA